VLTRSLTHDEYLRLRRFPALDGLRAVAALLVYVYHFGGPRWQFLSGWIGVHVFFVLSGYLITTLALREEGWTGRLALGDFYLRRIFRIMPVYLVCLALTVAVVFAKGTFVSSGIAADLPLYLTMFNEFSSADMFIFSWSIGIEQKFYLIWPLLAFAAGALAFRRRAAIALGALAVTVALGVGVAGTSWMIHYAVILVGCLLALVLHHPRGFAVLRPLTNPIAGLAVALVFVGVHLAVPAMKAGFGTEPPAIAIYSVAVAALVVVLLGATPVSWLLAVRPLVFVGARSYSLYLVQGIAAVLVGYLVFHGYLPQLRGLPMVGAVALVGLGLAHVLYHLVELPNIRYGRSLIERRRTRRRPAEAASVADAAGAAPVPAMVPPVAPSAVPPPRER
jgi:peptidoglycan/LPS O-acetylase OafA/YrhL